MTSAEDRFYRELVDERLVPLWTEIGDLMPPVPSSRATAYRWQWANLLSLAEAAGELFPVGRGGERRALALANPGLGGRPFATPTLWAAIQYLRPGENAPVHRHSQNAFRFVVEGEGVWTVVNGDAVAMRRGDFLPQAGWNWHGHLNESAAPMAWLDGLDIPLQAILESTFFEIGPKTATSDGLPRRSRSERLWGHPGLRPLTHLGPAPATPLLAYRWEHTDRALAEQLAMEADGYAVTVEPGHAAVRYVNPTTGDDVLPTIRADFHRFRPGAVSATRHEVGSSVYQVFDGAAEVRAGSETWSVGRGDLFVVPSWVPVTIGCAGEGVDLFRFTDAPVFERLGQYRVQVDASPASATGEPSGIEGIRPTNAVSG
jgi:gentisate 1,2-dioxygenase